MSPVTITVACAVAARLHRPRARCCASGWRVRPSCSDGHGHTLCPRCARTIRLHQHGDVATITPHLEPRP